MIQEFTKEQLDSEIWKDVVGYEGYYLVSSLGRIKSMPRETKNRYRFMTIIIKQTRTKSGYLFFSARKTGIKERTFNVHRIVCKAFIPNPENKPQVNHINGIRYDNRVENLEWCTAKENSWHCVNVIKTICRARGEEKVYAKLTEKQVLEIRDAYPKGGYTYKTLADKYNCDYSNIYKILHRVSWTHI